MELLSQIGTARKFSRVLGHVTFLPAKFENSRFSIFFPMFSIGLLDSTLLLGVKRNSWWFFVHFPHA